MRRTRRCTDVWVVSCHAPLHATWTRRDLISMPVSANGCGSSASALDGAALTNKVFDHAVAVVALHFNQAVFHGASGAASRFESSAEHNQRDGIQRQSPDHGHRFSVAAFGFPGHPYDTIRNRCRWSLGTRTLANGLAASGAHPAAFGAVNDPVAFLGLHHAERICFTLVYPAPESPLGPFAYPDGGAGRHAG